MCEPIGVVDNLEILTAENLAKLRRQAFDIARYRLGVAQIALLLFAVRVANHAGSAAN